MGKQSSWFGWLRRLFVCRGQTQIKRVRKWKWYSKGRVKRIEEASEEQRRYAVKVAIATAAAAEAAVAAAHAAAEIVRLTATSSNQKCSDKHLAAVRIQSAFRRYLGRKALVALKGVVKLQALVRGQLVRRRYVKINHFYPHHLGLFHSKLQSKSQRRWIYRQDMDTLCSKTNNVDLRRDRLIKYSFSHREGRNNLLVEETQSKRPETARHRQSQWLQQPITRSAILNPSTPDLSPTLQVRTRSGRKQDSIEGLYSPVSCPRRSFCRTNTFDEDNNAPNSPVFPAYMATTESAKARARSISTPRHRIGIHDSPWEHKNRRFSLCSSYNGDGFSSFGADDVSQFSPYSYKLKSPFLI